MNTILKVENLYVKNNEVEILKDISLSIKEGEILGIVGESGSGKSTIIKLISRQISSKKGGIFYEGIDYYNFTSNAKMIEGIVLAGVIAGMAVIRHLPNIKRLIAGTENKLSFGSKTA